MKTFLSVYSRTTDSLRASGFAACGLWALAFVAGCLAADDKSEPNDFKRCAAAMAVMSYVLAEI